MKIIKLLSISVLALCGLLTSATVYAASEAVKQMAAIMSHLEHYPSKAEIETLKGIVLSKDNSPDERIVATAIANLKHHVADEDRDVLKQVVNDGSAPGELRDLAGIVLGINHMPSAADKARLEAMMN
jgi:hypothetical protein